MKQSVTTDLKITYVKSVLAATLSLSVVVPVHADLFDWAYDGFKSASEAVAQYAQNTASNAANAARNTADAAKRGDFDAVAGEIVKLTVGWQAMTPFRATLLTQVNAIVPGQIGNYTTSATKIYKRIEDGGNDMRAKTYMGLYQAYKKDGLTAYERMSTGNFDFSAYYRYSLYYAVATADWSNPDAIAASAERIGRDQWAAYSWYSAHTVKGAAIGTARSEVGLTDEAIEKGVKDFLTMLKENPDMGAVGALAALEFTKAAKEAQCKTNPVYCSQPGQRVCGQPSEQHTVAVRNKSTQRLFSKVHVVSTQTHCENHVCDINGFIEPGQSRSCVVFGRRDDEQVQIYVQLWDPRGSNLRFRLDPNNDYPKIYPADGNPSFQWQFNKAAGNNIEFYLRGDSVPCMDAGNQHICGDISLTRLTQYWVDQAPANTIRDDRGQLACSPKDRDGIGRAFQDGNKNWFCQFGNGGQEHTYSSNFVFMNLDPNSAVWQPGYIPNPPVGTFTSPTMGLCRAYPGNGWPHKEFGWVYREGCVLGWGGRSPAIREYESLSVR